jgi:hypothetical protein
MRVVTMMIPERTRLEKNLKAKQANNECATKPLLQQLQQVAAYTITRSKTSQKPRKQE